MGRYDLRLSEDEFWCFTLKELNALIERHKANEEWLNFRPAQICALLANIHRGKGSKTYSLEDFMPQDRKREQTPEQILTSVTMLNAKLGGKVEEK